MITSVNNGIPEPPLCPSFSTTTPIMLHCKPSSAPHSNGKLLTAMCSYVHWTSQAIAVSHVMCWHQKEEA